MKTLVITSTILLVGSIMMPPSFADRKEPGSRAPAGFADNPSSIEEENTDKKSLTEMLKAIGAPKKKSLRSYENLNRSVDLTNDTNPRPNESGKGNGKSKDSSTHQE